MVDLPADIITDILSRLPVTSLLQFRSTSKSWRSLIDSDHFKTLHHNNCHKLNSKLILHRNSEFYSFDLPTPGNVTSLNQHPYSNQNRVIIIGSCNGLLCIKKGLDNLAIWNPSLRTHWNLPYSPSRVFGVGFGFGFDSFTGDYKLVEIPCFFIVEKYFLECKVHLFSCRTNTWKSLPNAWKTLPKAPYTSCSFVGVFVDHALHWVVTQNRRNLIIAFDLRFEVFDEVSLPELGERFEIKVSHLSGSLSMVVEYFEDYNHDITSRIDIWVMKQYGCKDSWFKLFSSADSLELNFLRYPAMPLFYCDGTKVLYKNKSNKLFWYNLKTKKVSQVTLPEMPNFSAAIIGVESFVQPPFPKESYRKQQKQQQTLEYKILQATEDV